MIVQHWSVEVATIITMGVANIYHTQKGQHSAYYTRF
jgi:hypothetical protein